MKQRELFSNSDLKSLFYNGEQTTTAAFLNNEQTHSQKQKDSMDSSLLIKILPTSSPIRWPHITPHSGFFYPNIKYKLVKKIVKDLIQAFIMYFYTFIFRF